MPDEMLSPLHDPAGGPANNGQLPEQRKQRAIQAAAVPLAHAYHVLETYPVEEAARLAYERGGPSVQELERDIAAWRLSHGHDSAPSGQLSDSQRKLREQAIAAAAMPLARAYRVLETYPVAEAARLAYTPGGPSIEELERRIAARRAAYQAGVHSPQGSDGQLLVSE